MLLEIASRALGVHPPVQRCLDCLRLPSALGHQDNFLALQNRGNPHGQRLMGLELAVLEVNRICLQRALSKLNRSRDTVQARAGLIEGDMAVLTDPKQLEIDR